MLGIKWSNLAGLGRLKPSGSELKVSEMGKSEKNSAISIRTLRGKTDPHLVLGHTN
jgi:hypothetical protein